MKPSILSIAAASFVVGAAVTCAIFRLAGLGHEMVAIVVGAILGTDIAVILHHRQSGATLPAKIKAQLGATLAITALATTAVLSVAIDWEEFPEIALPLSALGSFGFPFIIGSTLWNALQKTKDARKAKER
jgi:hypothetical protein